MYTTETLSRFLGVPRKTLERWRWLGTGPAFVKMPSGAVRYETRAVDDFIEKRRRTSTSSAPAAPQ